MPEYHEVQLMVKYYHHVFELFCNDTGRTPDWKPGLERVWYHPLKKECNAKGASKRRKAGYPEELPPKSAIMRGMNLGKRKRGGRKRSDKTRHYLAPRDCLPEGVSYQDLTLESITATSRSLVLNLGKATFQFQFLTHTNIQFYTRENWEAVMNTPRFKYGTKSEQKMLTFHVAIAFDFGDFVLSFNSHDSVFLPTWVTAEDAAAGRLNHVDSVDVVNDFDGYLEHVAQWLSEYPSLSDATKNSTIYNFLRNQSTIFPGVGMYSRTEILLRSGISPEMSVHEVVENRSRFYRLLLAVRQFKMQALQVLWDKHIKPAIRNYMLAPTVEERIRFSSTLLAFAQPVVKAPERFKRAVQRYNDELSAVLNFDADESYSTDGSSSEESDDDTPSAATSGALEEPQDEDEESQLNISEIISYDAFEPMFIVDALRLAPEFGPGIFGEEYWTAHCEELGISSTLGYNPVVETDKLSGAYLAGTSVINVDELSPLVLDKGAMKHIPNGLYNFTKTDKVWTPLKIFSGWTKKHIETYFFKTIVRTKNKVVVGMLEFSGNAVAIRRPGQQKRKNNVLPSRGAIPAGHIPGYIARRAIISTIVRIDEHKAEGTGMAPLSGESKKSRELAQAAFDNMWFDRFQCLPLPPNADADISNTSRSGSSTPASPPPETDSERALSSRSSSPLPDLELGGRSLSAEPDARTEQATASSSNVPLVGKRKRVRGDMAVMLEANTRLSDGMKRPRTSLGIGTDMRVHPSDKDIKNLK